mgnify:CR=1 FL=1
MFGVGVCWCRRRRRCFVIVGVVVVVAIVAVVVVVVGVVLIEGGGGGGDDGGKALLPFFADWGWTRVAWWLCRAYHSFGVLLCGCDGGVAVSFAHVVMTKFCTV